MAGAPNVSVFNPSASSTDSALASAAPAKRLGMREQSRKVVADALAETAGGDAGAVAETIEQAIFACFPDEKTKEYRTKIKVIAQTFKGPRNAQLRSAVLQGGISAEDVVTSDAKSLEARAKDFCAQAPVPTPPPAVPTPAPAPAPAPAAPAPTPAPEPGPVSALAPAIESPGAGMAMGVGPGLSEASLGQAAAALEPPLTPVPESDVPPQTEAAPSIEAQAAPPPPPAMTLPKQPVAPPEPMQSEGGGTLTETVAQAQAPLPPPAPSLTPPTAVAPPAAEMEKTMTVAAPELTALPPPTQPTPLSSRPRPRDMLDLQEAGPSQGQSQSRAFPSGVTATAPTAAVVTPATAPEASSTGSRSALEALRAARAQARERRQPCAVSQAGQNGNAAASAGSTEQSAKLAALQSELAVTAARERKLSERVAELEKELEQERERAVNNSRPSTPAGEAAAQRQAAARLANELHEAQRHLTEEREAATARERVLEERAAQLQVDLQELEAKLLQKATAAGDEVQSRLLEVEAQAAAKTREACDLKAHLEESQTETQRLVRELEVVKGERDTASSERDGLVVRCEDLKSEVQGVETTVSRLEKDKEVLRQACGRLERERESQSELTQNLVRERDDLVRRAAEAAAAPAPAPVAVPAAPGLQEELSQARKQMTQLQEQLASERAAATAATSQHRREAAEQAQEEARLRAELEALRLQVPSLQRQLEVLRVERRGKIAGLLERTKSASTIPSSPAPSSLDEPTLASEVAAESQTRGAMMATQAAAAPPMAAAVPPLQHAWASGLTPSAQAPPLPAAPSAAPPPAFAAAPVSVPVQAAVVGAGWDWEDVAPSTAGGATTVAAPAAAAVAAPAAGAVANVGAGPHGGGASLVGPAPPATAPAALPDLSWDSSAVSASASLGEGPGEQQAATSNAGGAHGVPTPDALFPDFPSPGPVVEFAEEKPEADAEPWRPLAETQTAADHPPAAESEQQDRGVHEMQAQSNSASVSASVPDISASFGVAGLFGDDENGGAGAGAPAPEVCSEADCITASFAPPPPVTETTPLPATNSEVASLFGFDDGPGQDSCSFAAVPAAFGAQPPSFPPSAPAPTPAPPLAAPPQATVPAPLATKPEPVSNAFLATPTPSTSPVPAPIPVATPAPAPTSAPFASAVDLFSDSATTSNSWFGGGGQAPAPAPPAMGTVPCASTSASASMSNSAEPQQPMPMASTSAMPPAAPQQTSVDDLFGSATGADASGLFSGGLRPPAPSPSPVPNLSPSPSPLPSFACDSRGDAASLF